MFPTPPFCGLSDPIIEGMLDDANGTIDGDVLYAMDDEVFRAGGEYRCGEESSLGFSKAKVDVGVCKPLLDVEVGALFRFPAIPLAMPNMAAQC